MNSTDYFVFLIDFYLTDNIGRGHASTDHNGPLVNSVATPVGNRFGFAGYWWDEHLGIYHVRHRAYDPYHGRWLQRDPVGLVGGWNLYQYCEGNPLSYTDPLGLWKWDNGWIQDGLGGLLGFHGLTPMTEGLKGAHDGLVVTSNSAVRNITFGGLGSTKEELAEGGALYDADNQMLDVSDAAGQVIGESVKLIALGSVAKLAECGTAAGNALKVALEMKAMYENVEGAIEAGELVIELATLIEAGDYEGAKALAIEKGAEILLEQLVAKTLKKIAKDIPCFVEGTPVETPQGPVAINKIEPGDRVFTGEESDARGETAVDPATWRLYTLEVGAVGEAERVGIIRLLRPVSWMAAEFNHADSSGLWVNLVIPEWGVNGLARVKSVEPCPEIKPGPGRVVLMKSITAYRGEMAKVTFDGFGVPLEGTWGHPVFSLDRGEFVPLGSLEPCERVRTADGWAVVESMARSWGETTVYNLEVEGEHQYLAGEARVVSHNDTVVGVGGGKGGCSSFAKDMSPDEAARYQKYWQQRYHSHGSGTRYRDQAAPGTRSITDPKVSSDGTVYSRQTIYDQYGRRMGNNDFTNHGRDCHPNPHHHTRDPVTGERSDPIPGLHPNTPESSI